MNKNDSTYIRQLTFWLRLLILAASIMTVAEDTLSFFTDKPIALFIDDTLWTKPISSFAIQDRLVLFGILNVKTMMWLIALYQIWKLCQLYRRTIFFTVQNARCFANIGRALVGMAVLDTLIVPLCGVFMKSQGIIAKMPDINIFMPEIDLLAAGIFFGLVSKIMERAAVMREEADFTI